MPLDPRSSINLDEIFQDPAMFDSRDAWERAGFKVPDRYGDNKILVASCDALPDYLFKKYANHVDLSKQLRNYERRIEGADRMRSFCARHRLRRIVVPHKWLYELPRSFSVDEEASYVLIVERLAILDLVASERAYGSIDAALLEELCRVLREFHGIDFTMTNAPFSEDGRIAFIDTGSWRKHKKRDHLGVLARHVTADAYDLAKKVLRE